MKTMIGYSIGDVLELVGVTRKRTLLEVLLPTLGLIAAGAVVGAGAGLALAPSSGRRLRRDLQQGMSGRLDRLRTRIQKERQSNSMVNAIPQQSS
jgi:hypothetical protein